MTRKISPGDWQNLSAYLDGQLGAGESARLETRLQSDLELQEALDELRRTRAVLRSHARLRAPRNFALTPQMVGARRPLPAFPILRLASALATILLVIVLFGDYLFSAGPMRGRLLSAPGQGTAVALEVAQKPQEERAVAPGPLQAAPAEKQAANVADQEATVLVEMEVGVQSEAGAPTEASEAPPAESLQAAAIPPPPGILPTEITLRATEAPAVNETAVVAKVMATAVVMSTQAALPTATPIALKPSASPSLAPSPTATGYPTDTYPPPLDSSATGRSAYPAPRDALAAAGSPTLTPSLTTTSTATPTPTSTGTLTTTPTPLGPMTSVITLTPVPSVTATATPSPTPTQTDTSTPVPTETLSPTDTTEPSATASPTWTQTAPASPTPDHGGTTAPYEAPPAVLSPTAPPGQVPPSEARPPYLRFFEGLLALIAILTGAAAFYLHRRNKYG